MKVFFLPLAAVLLLCQCGGLTGSRGELRGYRLGLEKGGADRAAGLSCTPTRYSAEYTGGEAEDFARGYLKGYERERR